MSGQTFGPSKIIIQSFLIESTVRFDMHKLRGKRKSNFFGFVFNAVFLFRLLFFLFGAQKEIALLLLHRSRIASTVWQNARKWVSTSYPLGFIWINSKSPDRSLDYDVTWKVAKLRCSMKQMIKLNPNNFQSTSFCV